MNQNEVAWAGGFFTGEGYVVLGKGAIHLGLDQVEKAPLERFHAAVGGLGRIYGPYHHKGKPNWQPQYVWRAIRIADVRLIVPLLWEWLSPRRQQQIADVLGRHQQRMEAKNCRPSAPVGDTLIHQ